MGAIKIERAQEADQSLIDAPQNAVTTRTRLLKDIESIREVMTDPEANNYQHTSGKAFMYPGANGAGNLHSTCMKLGTMRCNLMGYDNDRIMNYELGTFNDFITVANVAASDTSRLSVLVVTLDGQNEIELSNNVGSVLTVDGNTFSNYVGDYYLAQDYDTHNFYNIDDDISVFVSPAPYTPQNLINSEIAFKPEDGDYLPPDSETDTRFDFRISNNGVHVVDIYQPELVHNIKINSVSNDAPFTTTETILSGDKTMILDSISAVNTTTMTVDVVGKQMVERGATGFEISEKVQGLSSGAFGFVGTVNTAFRWTATEVGAELTDELVATIEGYDQDSWSQQYGTMNLSSYAVAEGIEFPAQLTLHHSQLAGTANTRDGRNYQTGNVFNITPPTFGKTLPMRRWRDHDDANPAHTTGLLAIITGRGLQMNFDWFVANNRHMDGLPAQSITKMDNDTFVPYLGWAANTDLSIVATTRPAEFRSNTQKSGSGKQQFFNSTREGAPGRPNDQYPYIEYNPFIPAGVEDFPEDSAPYAGTTAYWDESIANGNGAVEFAVYAEARWRYLPNPLLGGYDYGDPQSTFYHTTLPGYATDPANGSRALDVQTIKTATANDALAFGMNRLLNLKYDLNGANTGDMRFRPNTQSDNGTTQIGSVMTWETAGTTDFVIPAWTRDAVAGGGTPTVMPYFTVGNGGFNTYDNSVSQTIINTDPSTYPGFNHEPGVYYIKMEDSYGPRIWKLTGEYVVTAEMDSQVPPQPTGNHLHQLVWNAEEWHNEVNGLAMLMNSNDMSAFCDALYGRWLAQAQFAESVAGNTVYDIHADGHWDLYFGEATGPGSSNNKPGLTTYNHGFYAGDANIDQDRAIYRFVMDSMNVVRGWRTNFNDTMDNFTNVIGNKNGTTISIAQDSFTLYNTLNLCKQATDEWKLSVNNRIGYPTANTDNFPIGHGQSAFGYSEALYNFAEVLTGDAIGTLKQASNAIKNLDLIYDDVRRNRKKYKLYAS